MSIIRCCRHTRLDGTFEPVELDTCPCYEASDGKGRRYLPADVAERCRTMNWPTHELLRERSE